MTVPEMKATVVLVHGIWMRPAIMRRLGNGLIKQGFDVVYYQYASVRQSVRENAKRLDQFVQSIDASTIHFVAHSLGGIVLLDYFSLPVNHKPGRLVLLGSPVLGSLKAKRLSKLPLVRHMLGKSVQQGLIDHVCSQPRHHDVGAIAGTLPMGLAVVLGPFFKPNDGAVAVDETALDGLKDSLVLSVSHTGMLFNSEVIDQTAYFLKHGCFNHSKVKVTQ